MVRIAPVRLTFNPRTLWFDAGDYDLEVGQGVVVTTARGTEYGLLDKPVFEMDYEETKKLKSPLKPVQRVATEEDAARNEEFAELARAALPTFRRIAGEMLPAMNPVAVEYLFDGDKAVFYFESEERVDFRELVRKLAAEFHIRVDMKQIGVRDGARMVGGLGHCGQELCCRRLGGEFNPVSIRMAKEQDLSLNPQKISGVCGRLMCCLRYEYDAYKDFHSRAPKKNAKIATPDGEGKVVDLDVPREIVSIKVGDEKPVKVPLADMEALEGQARPNAVGEEAWERASEPVSSRIDSALSLFTTELSGEDKLAEPGKVRHVHGEDAKRQSKSRSRRRSGSSRAAKAADGEHASQQPQRKQRRRRSTTVKSDGSAQTEKQQARKQEAKDQGKQDQQPKRSSSGRRRRSRSSSKQQSAVATAQPQQKASQVGRNSSAIRANRKDDAANASGSGSGGGARRRRRSHRAGGSDATKSGE